MALIRLDALPELPPLAGAAATELAPDAPVVLRFAVSAADAPALDALRYARRSMLREEWTLGRVEGEPSLQDAVFTLTELLWQVPRGQAAACVRKLEELASRANRLLRET